MASSIDIKRLQAQINRWPASTWKNGALLAINGQLDAESALRALTIIEHGQILIGDQAGKARTVQAFADPQPAVLSHFDAVLADVTKISDAEKKPPATRVWPFPLWQIAAGLSTLGLISVLFVASRRMHHAALAVPTFDGVNDY